MPTIQERLSNGELVRVMFLGPLASPKLVEIVGLFGNMHGVWFDQEHAAISHDQLEILTLACRATSMDSFVRVAPTDYAAIMRPFEAGASGIMAAQVRGVEQVEQIIQWAKYAPAGCRGFYLGNVEAGYGTASPAQHVLAGNRDRWVAIQIETLEALEQVEQIAAVDGVNFLFVGPNDLSCALGVPGQAMHARCIDALKRISRAARNAGKPWGIVVRGAEHAAACRELGCQLFSLAGDLDVIHKGIAATKELYKDFFE